MVNLNKDRKSSLDILKLGNYLKDKTFLQIEFI